MIDYYSNERPEVSFLEAWKCFFKNFGIYNGRANKSEFLYVMVTNVFFEILLFMLYGFFGGSNEHDHSLNWFGNIIITMMMLHFLFFIIPSITLTIRRLHDMNRSGWLTLIYLIPFFGVISLLILLSQNGNVKGARFDNEQKPWHPAINN